MLFRRMLVALVAAVGVLAVARAAPAAPAQRVYLAPQTVRLAPGKPAILRGACLDEKIKGAPRSEDKITRFSDPSALVIRELKDGKLTGKEQNYSDILAGKVEKPWVAVKGGLDLTGRIDLSVHPVGEIPPGISYEVTVKKGIATAREAEPITDDLLNQLKSYQDPIDYIDGEFANWAKLFGEQNSFATRATKFAQNDVYWAIARDRKPEDVLSDAKKQVEQMFAELRDEDPVRQYLLVAAAVGRTEFSKEQREYLATHKIELKDLPAADQLSKKLAEALVNDPFVRRWFDPGEVRNDLREADRIFKASPDVERLFLSLHKPEIYHPFVLQSRLAALKAPQSVVPEFADGKITLKSETSTIDLTQVLNDLNANAKKRPSREYIALTGSNTLIDASGATPAQLRELAQTLSEIGRVAPFSTFRGRFALDKEASLRRNKELLDKGAYDVQVGGDTFKNLPLGELVEKVLIKLSFKLASGRGVEFHVAHQDGNVLDTLIKKAEMKEFKDKHLVLMICNKDTGRETFAKFVKLAKVALDNGAASVLVPDSELHVQTLTLAPLVLKQHPELLDAATPREVLEKCATLAQIKLATVRSRPPAEQLMELRKQFGAGEELDALFKDKDGTGIDPKLLDRIEKELPRTWRLFHELVIEPRPGSSAVS